MPEAFPRSSAATWSRCPPQRGSMSQVAKDFGISQSCLVRWVRRAEIEDGGRDGLTHAEEADIRELKKRNRLLEQENEVLRRAAIYLGKGVLPK
jgi:transposase